MKDNILKYFLFLELKGLTLMNVLRLDTIVFTAYKKNPSISNHLFDFLILGELAPSQFPVFTIYVQKNCLPSASLCQAAWNYERVMQHKLDVQPTTRAARENRQECMELCLQDVDCK